MKIRALFLTVILAMLVFAGMANAKDGTIVAGNNGTKWCCPGGIKGDGCEKGAASTPIGAKCNFASKNTIPLPDPPTKTVPIPKTEPPVAK